MAKRKVLLMISNSQVLMDMTKKILERGDYCVKCAAGEESAKELLVDYSFDGIIVDGELTDCDSISCLRDVLALGGAPALFMSEKQENELPALMAGACDFIKKPYNLDLFKARINVMLREFPADSVRLVPKIPLAGTYEDVLLNAAVLKSAAAAARDAASSAASSGAPAMAQTSPLAQALSPTPSWSLSSAGMPPTSSASATALAYASARAPTITQTQESAPVPIPAETIKEKRVAKRAAGMSLKKQVGQAIALAACFAVVFTLVMASPYVARMAFSPTGGGEGEGVNIFDDDVPLGSPYDAAAQGDGFIHIPAIKKIVMSAAADGTALLGEPLINHEDNSCSFIFELTLTDTGERLFTSDLLAPGSSVSGVTLAGNPASGVYTARLSVAMFTMASGGENPVQFAQTSIDFPIEIIHEISND